MIGHVLQKKRRLPLDVFSPLGALALASLSWRRVLSRRRVFRFSRRDLRKVLPVGLFTLRALGPFPRRWVLRKALLFVRLIRRALRMALILTRLFQRL